MYFIDGSDLESSSWMRFIQCARSKQEQNLFAFQYRGNVYYRSFKDIAVGEELLVWYDDKYLQHFGIPTGLQEICFVIDHGGTFIKRLFSIEYIRLTQISRRMVLAKSKVLSVQ